MGHSRLLPPTIAKELLTFETVYDSLASDFYVPTFQDIKFRLQGITQKKGYVQQILT